MAPTYGVGAPVAREAGRRAAGGLEVVAPAHRDLAAVVDDDQLVRQVQHEVALVRRPLEPQADRLELERQVVAEGAVQAEVRLVGMVEERR